MAPLTSVAGIVLTVIASAPSASVNAFAPVSTSHRHVTSTTWSPIIVSPLQMSEEASAEETTVEESAEEVAEPEEPQLDPEVVALKESIVSLESDLKAKKSQLNNLKEMTEKYSSTGYARQVALMENNKRMRGANMADNKQAARATVLQSFLPLFEALDEVGAKYEGNVFAKSLDGGLRGELQNSLNDLGVSKYVVESGATMEVGRVVAVEEEHSEEFAKGVVIRPLKSGLEISGNVIKPAEVVGSLGAASKGFGDAGETEEAPAE